MTRVLSTHLFVAQKLTVDMLRRAEEAGVRLIEIFCARQHFDYTNRIQVREISDWLADHAITLHSLHSPMHRDYEWGRAGDRPISIADIEKTHRTDAVDEIKRAIEVSERIPFRYLIQHIGVPQEEHDPRKLDAAFWSLEQLVLFAHQCGVRILLENIPNELSAPMTLKQFIESTHMKDLGVCFDTGHAHLGEGVERSFELLRDWIVSTHVHDNKGDKDEHLFPFDGTIDWQKTIPLLRDAPRALPVVLELRDYGEYPKPVEKAIEVFDRFEQQWAKPAETAIRPEMKTVERKAGV